MRRVTVIGLVLLAFVAVACRPYDFDGDGEADFVLVTPDGDWYRYGDPAPIFEAPPGFDFLSHAPGNYDGGNTPEPANVSGEGDWHVRGSTGTFSFPPAPGTLYPVPADYDGDGTTEAAWYTDDATWHLQGQAPVQFGLSRDDAPVDWLGESFPLGLHDIPVPADYDGDGDDDLAVYRVLDGTFHVQGMGQIADLALGFPAPGDYDGDGIDEPVVYRDNSMLTPWPDHTIDYHRAWYFGDGSMVEQPADGMFLGDAAVPVPADYDGDGDDDLTLFAVEDQTFLFQDGRAPVDFDGYPFESVPASMRPWMLVEITRLTFLMHETGQVVPYDFNGSQSADHVAVGYDNGWYQSYDGVPFFSASLSGLPAAGDYDGDARWEAATVGDATWETAGGRGTFTFAPWGGSPPDTGLDVFIPADYDGDLVTEPAWYDGSLARWHIEGREPIDFGEPASMYPDDWAEVPVPADYDGDGQDEIAVYRPTDGTFHVQGMGQVADLPLGYPAAADFDGDGVDDPAAYNSIDRRWYFSDGTTLDVDPSVDDDTLPVPADYDGDAVDEPVVYDLATETFHSPTETVVAADGLVDVEWPATLPPGLLYRLIQLWYLQLCSAPPASC